MSFHRACCCGDGGGGDEPVFSSCVRLVNNGDLPTTITMEVEFDVSYRQPIPFTFNSESVFYTGSYSVGVDFDSCLSGGCEWVNNDGYPAYSGSATVRRIVYDGDGAVLSDDTATAVIPDDMGIIEPIASAICVTGTNPTTPTIWDLTSDPDLSDGLTGSGGNTVFAALVGFQGDRNMPQSFFPADIPAAEPFEIFIPTGSFSSITGQQLIDAQVSDPANYEVFTMSLSIAFT